MNRILPAALILALSSGIALTQQQPAPIERQAPALQADSQPPVRHHQHNPAREAAHLAKTLNLNADQQAKLEPVLADRQQKVAALQANTTLDPKSKHQQMHAIRISTEQQLATFLTPDQLQQLKAMRKAHRRGQNEPVSPAPAA